MIALAMNGRSKVGSPVAIASPTGDSVGARRQGPIAGRAIADAAYARYTDVTARFKQGKATVGEMVAARREYDAAQTAVEAAERVTFESHRPRRHRGY